jgi:hypothetical protein
MIYSQSILGICHKEQTPRIVAVVLYDVTVID